MGGSGRVCLPTSSHLGQSGGEVARLPMQENHSDCSGVAQYALVLGSSGHVQPNPTQPVQSAQLVDTALQSDPSQKSDLNLHAWLLEPQQTRSRASLRRLQQKLKLLERDQPDQSMRQSGPLFTKWCFSNQVYFKAPPVNSVTDFLMYLFQGRKL